MKISTVFERAVIHWRERGVSILPPASESEIARVFADIGQPLSADVRGLYGAIGGFTDYTCDGLWSLWSLHRLLTENASRRRPFVMFADWCIHSHVYCIRYENPDNSSVFVSHNGVALEDTPVAGTVELFLEKLLVDSGDVQAWNLD